MATHGNRSTEQTEFGHIPVLDANVFAVRAGVDQDTALGQAECLESAVRELLTDAVGEGSMTADKAWLCRFALDAATAVRTACGQKV